MPTIEELERFFSIYWDVRNVVIEFQMTGPKGKVYKYILPIYIGGG